MGRGTLVEEDEEELEEEEEGVWRRRERAGHEGVTEDEIEAAA